MSSTVIVTEFGVTVDGVYREHHGPWPRPRPRKAWSKLKITECR